MKVVPIIPVSPPRFRHRAAISVRAYGGGRVEHAVTDLETGERVVLPEQEAWDLHQAINRLV